jgi:hypothetical protein
MSPQVPPERCCGSRRPCGLAACFGFPGSISTGVVTLRSAKELQSFSIGATDGPVGEVKDFYFYDHVWIVRCLVVETGSWLSNRRVLIALTSLGELELGSEVIPANLTRAQVRDSPALDTHKPISRQEEEKLLTYYGHAYYWGGIGLIENDPSPLHRGALAPALLALTPCATMSTGMGGGDLSPAPHDAVPVLFAWQSKDGGLSGTVTAALPNRIFTGSFIGITLQTRRESLEPFWSGWNEGWSDWPDGVTGWDGPSASAQFTRYCSGKVIANLRDAVGHAMRCRFDLDAATRGMSGGAHGQCQLGGGKILNARIDRK